MTRVVHLFRQSSVRARAVLVGVVALLGIVSATDRGRAATDPVEECVAYSAELRRCFGDGAGRSLMRAPPKDAAAREVVRKQCIQGKARLERACR